MTMPSSAPTSIRVRQIIGTLAMSGALVAGTVGLAPAAAQEAEPGEEATDPDEGDPAPTGDAAPLEIAASTLYVSPTSDAIPPTLRNQVPPAALCVVQPELCPDGAKPVFDGVRDGLRQVNDNEPAPPVQPVPPDTAAVSFLGGQTRYQTAVKFDVPSVPDGHEVVQFTVGFPQAEPSYEIGSPAFRRAVLAVFEAIGPQDPAILAEGLAAALQEDPAEVDPELIGIEACPLLSEFTPGGAPQASSDAELPRRQEGDDEVVDIDCIFGTNGMRGEDGRWSFDLTFTAGAWATGELQNHGLLLRPIGAPNLAFGDPDTSTTAQVALNLTGVEAAMQTAEPPPPVEPMAGADGGFEEPMVAEAGGIDDGGFDDGGGFDGGGGFDDAGFDDAAGGTADGAEFDETPVGDGEAEATPGAEVAAPDEAPQASATTAADPAPGQPWWTWLLLPVFVGGAYVTSQALTATTAAGGASVGSGALSRLMARRGGASPA